MKHKIITALAQAKSKTAALLATAALIMPTAAIMMFPGAASAQHESDNYGPGAMYQVELSANIGGSQGGGVWLWMALYPNAAGTGGTVDYAGSDCGHGGGGASSDKGDATWQYVNGDSQIEIDGVVLNGLGVFPTTITVPSTYGHYTGTVGTYLTLPGFIPPFVGFTQLQVAR